MDVSLQRQRDVPSRKRPKRSNLVFSIDVLTDGSEGTEGSGLVFLSLWEGRSHMYDLLTKESSVDKSHHHHHHHNDNNNWWEGIPKARYALNLGSDTCSRLATDQRFKLAQTRAVFAGDSTSLWGYKALQLALERAGAKSVHVVSSHIGIEQIVDRRDALCPMVHLCDLAELSLSSSSQNGVASSASSWWQVYSDEHLIVHAKHVTPSVESCTESSSSSSWAFLYTLCQMTPLHDDEISFLVLPPSSETCLLTENKIHTTNLPVINDKTIQCNFLVALKPANSFALENGHDDTVPPIFVVQATPGPCHNLLVRARRQAQMWHKQCPAYFPLTQTYTNDSPMSASSKVSLPTGTSLCGWVREDNNNGASSIPNLAFYHLDRMQGLRKENFDSATISAGNETETAAPCPRERWPEKLRDFLQSPVPCCTPCNDDNEINIDEEDDEEEDDAPSIAMENPCILELLSLGTGCAAPSAYRGASAYFIRPTNGTRTLGSILLEAGEGVVTQYLRHVSSDIQSLLSLSLIWVSHAHWDHYGGLVPLLATLQRLRRQANKSDGDSIRAPLLLAPHVVIRYCQTMLCQKKPGEWFYFAAQEDGPALGRVLGEWNQRYGSMVAFWENVLVDHSCRNSYGCVFGLRVPGRTQPFTIGFSGDTRPCQRFAQACRQLGIDGEIDFLLHEATFDDEEKEMAIKKKHSTVQEAIRVGQDVRSTKVLLSHFSQRYDSLPKIPPHFATQVGFALDGMRIILV